MFRYLCRIIFTTLVLTVFNSWVQADPLPNFTAQAYLVADAQGNILYGSNTENVRSIASITKLMSAIVVLDANQNMTEILPKKLYGKNVNRQTLLDLSMVRSDNNAAKMLCDYYPGGFKNCVQAMNEKAKMLFMFDTSFIDPTGLYNDNVSTAKDLIKLVTAASMYPAIVEASNKQFVTFPINKRKSLFFNNTNSMVGNGMKFLVSKTGYIRNSGGCIVMMLETVKGLRTVILLGSKNTKTRIPEAHLLSALF